MATTIPTPPNAGVPLEFAPLAPPPKVDMKKITPDIGKTATLVPPEQSRLKVPEKVTPSTTSESTNQNMENLTGKKEINQALEKVAQILLDLKDTRVALAALARQAGEGEMTPMGAEFRRSIIENLATDQTLDPSVREPFQSMSLPEKPTTSPFEQFLKQNEAIIPPDAINRIMLDLNSGKMSVEDFAQMMQSHEPLREPFFTALLGENHAKFNTPADVLTAAGIDGTDQKNIKAFHETFKPDKPLRMHGPIDKQLAIGIAMMVVSFSLGLFSQDQGQAQAAHH